MVARPLVLLVALRGHPRRMVPVRLVGWAVASTPLWLAGALVPDLRLPLWVVAESAAQTHLFMVLAVLVSAVGYELVIAHPYDAADARWLVFVVGGPALFLAARSRFEYEIFGRVSRSRLVGLAGLLLLAPVLTAGPVLLALAVVAGMLALVALADVWHARGGPPESSASPVGREALGKAGPEA